MDLRVIDTLWPDQLAEGDYIRFGGAQGEIVDIVDRDTYYQVYIINDNNYREKDDLILSVESVVELLSADYPVEV
jgi:hypothetical protein